MSLLSAADNSAALESDTQTQRAWILTKHLLLFFVLMTLWEV